MGTRAYTVPNTTENGSLLSILSLLLKKILSEENKEAVWGILTDNGHLQLRSCQRIVGTLGLMEYTCGGLVE